MTIIFNVCDFDLAKVIFNLFLYVISFPIVSTTQVYSIRTLFVPTRASVTRPCISEIAVEGVIYYSAKPLLLTERVSWVGLSPIILP